MKQAGTVLGVGEARVSQIHSAALARLRARLREPQRAATRVFPTAGDHPRSSSEASHKSLPQI
jgi:hypothetical protein